MTNMEKLIKKWEDRIKEYKILRDNAFDNLHISMYEDYDDLVGFWSEALNELKIALTGSS